MSIRWVASAATLLASCSALFAHDLYLMPDTFTVAKGQVFFVSLHNGDSFPESEVRPGVGSRERHESGFGERFGRS